MLSLSTVTMSTRVVEATPEMLRGCAHLQNTLVDNGHALGMERVIEITKGWVRTTLFPRVKFVQGVDTVTLAWISSKLRKEMGMPQTQWDGMWSGCVWKVPLQTLNEKQSQVIQSIKQSIITSER